MYISTRLPALESLESVLRRYLGCWNGFYSPRTVFLQFGQYFNGVGQYFRSLDCILMYMDCISNGLEKPAMIYEDFMAIKDFFHAPPYNKRKGALS